MDKNIQIQLGSTKNINSVDVDNFDTIELSIQPTLIQEYDVRNVISASEVFDDERQSTPIYRIYGSLEYLSLLNGLQTTYNELEDFFNPVSTTSQDRRNRSSQDRRNRRLGKTIFNDFDFYLVVPDTGGTLISYTGETTVNTQYVLNENFSKWATYADEFGIYPLGWDIGGIMGSILPYSSKGTKTGDLQLFTHAKIMLSSYILNNETVGGSLNMYRTVPEYYGDLTIETYITIENDDFDAGIDKFTIRLIGQTGDIGSYNAIAQNTGLFKITVPIPIDNPIVAVRIAALGINKTMYVDYIKLYKRDISIDDTYAWEGFLRNFKIIATPNDFELYKIGLTKNVFNEQKYAFNFNKDIDISNYFDAIGFPVTELFLYAKYKIKDSRNGFEELKYTQWNEDGDGYDWVDVPQIDSTGVIYGDAIQYSKLEYTQEQLYPQIYRIYTPYEDGTLVWKYNPFIPIRLRYLSSSVSRANSGSTSYYQTTAIPDYAIKLDNDGNYVWREILPQGYTDPISAEGVDYPFVNNRRYLFTNIILSVVPDLSHTHTKTIFNALSFGDSLISMKTLNDINNIDKPCQ